MNDCNDNDKDANPLPPPWSTDHQFDTPSNGAKSRSLPFSGTAPPQVTDDHAPETFEAIKYASASSTKKWTDTSDESKDSPADRNGKFVFSAAGIDDLFDEAAAMEDVDHIAMDEFMGPSSPSLSSMKNEEESFSGESPPEKEAQPSRDSPCTESTCLRSSTDTDMWHTRFEELKEYKKNHGDFNVPQKHGPLGVWVNKQRNEYNKFEKGIKSQLTPVRISQLDSINFTWARVYGQELWEMRFNELLDFKAKVSRDCAHTWSVDCFLPPAQSVYASSFRMVIAT